MEEVTRAKTPDLEALLRAFVTPLLRRSARRDPGGKNYARLVAQTANLRWSYLVPEMNDVNDSFDGTGMLLIKLIRRAVPGLSARDALFGFSSSSPRC